MFGVVLAGGESRRMGRDKAGIVFEGQPLWRRQVEVLRTAGAEPVVVARRRGQASLEGVPCLWDTVVGVGPMGGLLSALRECRDAHVAILAVDMPGIDAGWFSWLLRFCGPAVGAVARHPDACEPLAAVYPREALPAVQASLERGEHSVQRLVLELSDAGRMVLVTVPFSRSASLCSLNWPSQLEPDSLTGTVG